MRPRRWGRQQPLLPAVLGAVSVAWLLVVGAYATGHAEWFGHDLLNVPHWSSVVVAIVAWELMTVAMMVPSCLPIARYVAANTLRPERTVTAFLAGYLASWTMFLGAFALPDGMAHALLDPAPLSANGASILSGIAVAFAAGWQVTTTKHNLLRACRTVRVLPAHGGRAEAEARRLGLRQGLNCIGSCGPLMIAMLVAAYGRLTLMVAVAVLAWLEKATTAGRRIPRPSAALLAAVAVAYVAVGVSGLAAQRIPLPP